MAGKARDLIVNIDGDPQGFDKACKAAEQAAKKFDTELVKLGVAEKEQERLLKSATASTDKFAKSQTDAGLAARKLALAEKEAGDRAQRAGELAAEAAKKVERGEISAEVAARAQTRAENALEKALIASAIAMKAEAKEAQNLAENERQAAREAVLASGTERLGVLRSSGAVKEHNDLLAKMRTEFKDLGRDGDKAFVDMETIGQRAFKILKDGGTSAISSITSAMSNIPMLGGLSGMSGPAGLGAAAAAVLVALMALPVIAVAVAGSIEVALGGALAAVGIMAAAKAQVVQTAFANMKSHVGASLKDMATPFEPVLIHIASLASSTFDSLAPMLKRAFETMAPAIGQFADGVAKGLVSLGPALAGLAAEFGPIMRALGDQMPALFGALGSTINNLGDAIKGHESDFASMVVALAQIANGASIVIKWLAGMYDNVNAVWDALTGGHAATKAVGLTTYAISQAGDATNQWAGATAQATIDEQGATLAADELKKSLDALTGTAISARDAQIAYGDAIIAMNKSLHANGAENGFATEKGLANEKALMKLVQASQRYAEAMQAAGAKTSDVDKYMQTARQRIVDAALAMHYSKDEADKLATKLFGVAKAAGSIKSPAPIHVKADVSQALAAIQNVLNLLDFGIPTLPSKTHSTGGVAGHAAGGRVGYATAGRVSGPGTGTSDSIPAWLSNGEFVVNAQATKWWLPILEQINGGVKAHPSGSWGPDWGTDSGATPHRELVAPPHRGLRSYAHAASGVINVTHQTIHVQGSVWQATELLDVVARHANQRNVRNPGQSTFGKR